MSHQAHSILLTQLIATFIQQPLTVTLTGLADWSVFLEQVLPTMLIHDCNDRTLGGHYMERHVPDIHLSGSEASFSSCKHVWAYGWHYLES